MCLHIVLYEMKRNCYDINLGLKYDIDKSLPSSAVVNSENYEGCCTNIWDSVDTLFCWTQLNARPSNIWRDQ